MLGVARAAQTEAEESGGGAAEEVRHRAKQALRRTIEAMDALDAEIGRRVSSQSQSGADADDAETNASAAGEAAPLPPSVLRELVAAHGEDSSLEVPMLCPRATTNGVGLLGPLSVYRGRMHVSVRQRRDAQLL